MQVSALIAFIGGVLTLFAPCAAMLLPSFFAYAFSSRHVLVARTLVFALGVVIALLPLGIFAGSLSVFLQDNARLVSLVLGAVVIVLGVLQAFAVSFPVPAFANRLVARSTSASAEKSPSAVGVFLLGFGYALAGVGCSGPILGAVLAYGSFGGSPVWGAVLMVCYGLGMAAPVALLALLWDVLGVSQKAWLRPRPVQVLGRWTTVMNLVSGFIFVVLGLVLLLFQGQLPLLALASGESQVELESAVSGALATVPGWLFFAFFGALVALLVLRFKGSK